MAEPDGLGRKKRIRAGHKASATRILRQVDEIAGSDEVTEADRSRLAQLKLGLEEKLATLKQLDAEILELTAEEGLEAEIEQSDTYKEGIYGAIVKISKRTDPETTTTGLVAAATDGPDESPQVTKASLEQLPGRCC